MPNDDQGQVADAAEPAVIPPLELVTPVTAPSGDPLDAIQDTVARAEAKKARAIYNRHKGGETVQPEPQAVPANAASKEDLARLVTSQAKERVSAEIRDNWDDIAKIPVSGYDPLDPASIQKNMERRFVIWKTENPDKAGNPAAPLQVTIGTPGQGSSPAAPAPKKDPYAPKVTPDQWYPPKS